MRALAGVPGSPGSVQEGCRVGWVIASHPFHREYGVPGRKHPLLLEPEAERCSSPLMTGVGEGVEAEGTRGEELTGGRRVIRGLSCLCQAS